MHGRPAAMPAPVAPPKAYGICSPPASRSDFFPGAAPRASHTVSDLQVTPGARQKGASVSQDGELRCRKGLWRGGVEARALSVADVLGRMQHVEQDATATPASSLEVK